MISSRHGFSRVNRTIVRVNFVLRDGDGCDRVCTRITVWTVLGSNTLLLMDKTSPTLRSSLEGNGATAAPLMKPGPPCRWAHCRRRAAILYALLPPSR